ncbi:MAG: DUF6916 family protein [Candidatus Binataceae bacterium]
MHISRRTLLKAGAICAAGAAFPVSLAAAEISQAPARNLRDVSFETFRLWSNDSFRVSHQGGTRALKLVEVRNRLVPGRSAANQRECFSLLFRGSANVSLKQGTYLFHHPELGAFAMFLVPVNQPLSDGGHHYQVVVNRRARSA